MNPVSEETSVPVFEIDQPENYGQYILANPLEILRHLRLLQLQRHFITLYLDAGQRFFLTTILAIDEANQRLLLDPPGQAALLQPALDAAQGTMTTLVERVKIQWRMPALRLAEHEGKPALLTALPPRILRLQRREFFRIETPILTPLRCKFARIHEDGRAEAFDFPLFDISGGGMCLTGPISHADKFTLGELFADCRLDIPGESVLSVNMRIREVSRIETASNEQQLRLGCEFVNLPGTRQTLIERYITRLERERKARLQAAN
jgi:c-di-GMP-binding flagellar brake protein YcgR